MMKIVGCSPPDRHLCHFFSPGTTVRDSPLICCGECNVRVSVGVSQSLQTGSLQSPGPGLSEAPVEPPATAHHTTTCRTTPPLSSLQSLQSPASSLQSLVSSLQSLASMFQSLQSLVSIGSSLPKPNLWPLLSVGQKSRTNPKIVSVKATCTLIDCLIMRGKPSPAPGPRPPLSQILCLHTRPLSLLDWTLERVFIVKSSDGINQRSNQQHHHN